MVYCRCATGLFLCVSAAFAQLSTLEGDVKGGDGKPVVGAMVKISRLDVNRSYPAKTDKKGHYYYGSLPLGFYTVTVQVEGRDVAAVTGIRTQPGDPIVISFNLSDTPEGHAKRAIEAIRRVQGEWSYVRPVPIAPAVQPAPAPAAATPAPKAAEAKPNPDDPSIAAAAAESEAKRDEEVAAAQAQTVAFAKAGKYSEMRSQLKKSAGLDPANAFRIYYNQGVLLTNAGQADAASEAFKMAIDAAPGEPLNAEAYFQYAVGLMAKAQVGSGGKLSPVAGTVEAFETYLRLAPDGPNALSAKALLATLSPRP